MVQPPKGDRSGRRSRNIRGGVPKAKKDQQRKIRRKLMHETDPRVVAAKQEVAANEAWLQKLDAGLQGARAAGASFTLARRQAEERAAEEQLQATKALALEQAREHGHRAARELVKLPPMVLSRTREHGDPMPEDSSGLRRGWTMENARELLRSGYHIHHVIWLTGYGRAWLEDIPLDADGYGLWSEAWGLAMAALPKRNILEVDELAS